MAPRLPRHEQREATCEQLRELASAYTPTLRFAEGEQHYPVRAESWLTNATAADWPETAGRRGADIAVDGRRRGTTLVRGDASVGVVTPLAGTPVHDTPLVLHGDADDPRDLAAHTSDGADLFLSFAGWSDGDARTRGDDALLAQTFSELAAAIDPATTWVPRDTDPSRWPNLPTMWVPQPPTLTTYCEIEWGGMYTTWAAEQGLPEFAREMGGGRLRSLDDSLVLTYYYLYPHRHPIDGGAPTRLEGQWEAVSLFFPAEAGERRRADGRPEQLLFDEAPELIVVSQGLDGGVHRVSARRWEDVERVPIAGAPVMTHLAAGPRLQASTSAVLYVGRGTHVFHFTPQSGHDWLEDPRPGGDLDLSLDEDLFWPQLLFMLLWFVLAVAAAVIAGLLFAAAVAAVALAALGLAALAVLVALIALVLLVLAIFALFGLLADHGSDTQPHPQNEEAPGDGPEGGSSEPAAGDPHGDVTGGGGPAGGGGPGGGAAQPPGTPNAGSPTGRNTVAFDLRVVDRLNHDRLTPFPPPEPCELPGWWDFTGGWGVRVPVRIGSGWTSGMRRVDDQRRSWAYYAAAEKARLEDL